MGANQRCLFSLSNSLFPFFGLSFWLRAFHLPLGKGAHLRSSSSSTRRARIQHPPWRRSHHVPREVSGVAWQSPSPASFVPTPPTRQATREAARPTADRRQRPDAQLPDHRVVLRCPVVHRDRPGLSVTWATCPTCKLELLKCAVTRRSSSSRRYSRSSACYDV